MALHYLSLTALATALQQRQRSPVAVLEAIAERIDAIDPRARSYATLMMTSARAEAEAAEREITAGRYRGPLHGVPIAVKDLCFTAGVPTRGGCAVWADHVPTHDGTVVERLRAAGAVLVGKLNLTEGAMGGYHPDFAIPRNPWHAERWSGSSSSGSGVATALGLCYGSLGSDTGGSIRFPSAVNGVVGLKPTWGRVSRAGVLPLAETMDHVGPMTRTVADAAAVLQVIAGRDPGDPTSLAAPVPDFSAGLGAGVRGLRIGVDERFAGDGVDAQMVAAFHDALAALEHQGAVLVDVAMPDVDAFVPAWPVLCTAEAVVAHRAHYPARRADYGPWFRAWLDRGARVSVAELIEAQSMRLACNGLIAAAASTVDLLACPSMIGPAHPVTDAGNYGPPDDLRGTTFQRFTVPFNFNGAPTLSMPCGMTDDGLPLSLQLVAKHLDEGLLCQAGHAFEQASSWHQRHPPEPA